MHHVHNVRAKNHAVNPCTMSTAYTQRTMQLIHAPCAQCTCVVQRTMQLIHAQQQKTVNNRNDG